MAKATKSKKPRKTKRAAASRKPKSAKASARKKMAKRKPARKSAARAQAPSGMTDQRPSLTAQIEAVQWAETHARYLARQTHMRESEADELERRLAAAAETLRTLEFGQEVLK